MNEVDPQLIDELANDAEKLYNELNSDQRWQMALDEWQSVEDEISPTHPSRAELENYLKSIVKGVLLNVTKKEARFTRALLVNVVNQLVLYLITDLHFQSLVPYKIGIGFLATIIIDVILETTGSFIEPNNNPNQ